MFTRKKKKKVKHPEGFQSSQSGFVEERISYKLLSLSVDDISWGSESYHT